MEPNQLSHLCLAAWSKVIRLAGSLSSNCVMKSYSSSLVSPQHGRSNCNSSLIVILATFLLSSWSKGKLPLIRAYVKHPKLHASHEYEYGCFNNTSGATYPNVPKGSSAFSVGPIIFDSPKSTNFGVELSSSLLIMMFSSFTSLWTIP